MESRIPTTREPALPPPVPVDVAAVRKDPLAVAGFVLGILAILPFSRFLFFWVSPGVPLLQALAITFSVLAWLRFRRSDKFSGRGFAIAGFVMGVLGLFWSLPWRIW